MEKLVFFDYEFTGLRKDTTPVSLGIVSECGHKFYAEFTDYDKEQVEPWLKENVLSKLVMGKCVSELKVLSPYVKKAMPDLTRVCYKSEIEESDIGGSIQRIKPRVGDDPKNLFYRFEDGVVKVLIVTEDLKEAGDCYALGTVDEIRTYLEGWLSKLSRKVTVTRNGNDVTVREGRHTLRFVGDVMPYDWTLLTDMFGGAFGIPKYVHYTPLDLATAFYTLGKRPGINREKFVKRVKGNTNLHNSLYDAELIKDCWEHLHSKYNKRPRPKSDDDLNDFVPEVSHEPMGDVGENIRKLRTFPQDGIRFYERSGIVYTAVVGGCKIFLRSVDGRSIKPMDEFVNEEGWEREVEEQGFTPLHVVMEE